MWYVIKEDELYHHGILGQKWGVRRFQNKDGSLTSAGKKRYGSEGSDSREKKPINGKKIAVAVGATVAGGAAVGLYAKYHNEINAIVKQEAAKGTAVFNGRKPEMIAAGKKFLNGQKKNLGKALEQVVTESTSAVFAAPVAVATGYGLQKISEHSNKAKQEKGQSYMRDVMTEIGNRSLNSVNKAFDGKNSGNKSSNNKAKFSESEEKAYSKFFQRSDLTDAQRATIKRMRKEEGASFEEIERYVDSL